MLSDALMFDSNAAIERGAVTGRPANHHPLKPDHMRADVFDGQRIFRDSETGAIYYLTTS